MKKSVKLLSILLVFILSFSVIQTSFIASAADAGSAYCETYEIESRQATVPVGVAAADAATPGEATPPASEKSEFAQELDEFFDNEFFAFLKSFINFLIDFIFILIG